MGLSGRDCPDCGRRVREPFEQTATGREVCRDCAYALLTGSVAGVVTGDAGSGYGARAMLVRKLRRSADGRT